MKFSNVINIPRGDTLVASININVGTKIHPIQYMLKGNDKVYFAVMEANQPFENAIVKKVFNKDSRVTATGGLIVGLNSRDTQYLMPGKYYYTIKIRFENGIVKTLIPHRQLIITGNPFYRNADYAQSVIQDNFNPLSSTIQNDFDAIQTEIDNLKQQMSIKANNIIYHEEDSTIQLANGTTGIGDRIQVATKQGKQIQKVLIIDKHLYVFFTDDTFNDLGQVSFEDDHVYIPSVDNGVITFNLSTNPTIPQIKIDTIDDWGEISDELLEQEALTNVWDTGIV